MARSSAGSLTGQHHKAKRLGGVDAVGGLVVAISVQRPVPRRIWSPLDVENISDDFRTVRNVGDVSQVKSLVAPSS